jgi:hypothetical protein
MMRLVYCDKDGDLRLTEFVDEAIIPPYAILSHIWVTSQEVSFKDVENGTGTDKFGYRKIQFCAEQAKKDGLLYFWIDTCCIDRTNSDELDHAINSLFRWYRNAARRYVYLSDVATVLPSKSTRKHSLPTSQWFGRCWTLQELLAPNEIEFFSQTGQRLGNKTTLANVIHEVTGIPSLLFARHLRCIYAS